MKCSICKQEKLSKFLSFGKQPPSNAFIKKEDLNKPEAYYPLETFYCENCSLVQLGYIVDPKILFNEYSYTTGTNNSLIKNFNELVKKLVNEFKLTKNDLAIDIGSNDGTLLKNYLEHNVKILGIEPSSVADIAIQNDVPTFKGFFNKETAIEISKKHEKAKVVTATNVFAHVKDIASFMEGIKEILKDDGIFVQESHYFLSLFKNMQWDSIYHEHIRYYTLKSLKYLFDLFDMDLFDAEIISTHGGSIRTYSCKKGNHKISKNIMTLLKTEEDAGLFEKDTYLRFGKDVVAHKTEIQELLAGLKKEGKEIIGIGAPAKGNTLLNYCEITPKIMSCLAEKSDLKIGLYTPGTHIEVVKESTALERNPDLAFMLSWNIADELIPKLKKLGFNGKFVVPSPKLRIVE